MYIYTVNISCWMTQGACGVYFFFCVEFFAMHPFPPGTLVFFHSPTTQLQRTYSLRKTISVCERIIAHYMATLVLLICWNSYM